MIDLAMNQEQEENSERQVQPHEADQGEEPVARRDARGKTLGGPHDAVD